MYFFDFCFPVCNIEFGGINVTGKKICKIKHGNYGYHA